eukprot:TRINITY_DN1929_c0_g1_i1.p1 TRINITY_DN1929_c0_g1~~TRINITY_DN1929_c0_g1_i1.p1  ORF type:complete len:1137 (-),score=265.70 TRINITY_DN1929_c0_g1_i1:1300-4710(-)
MNPGRGVYQLSSACRLLLLLLHLGSAQLVQQEGGNVGCLFSGLVCTPNEVCFNDLVIGRCVSASSDNQQVARLGPLEGPPLGLLEAEMSRVFGLGYSWPDIYTQCVFQTLLHNIQNRQPYSKQQCAHLLMAQRLVSEEGEDSGDNEGEEEGDDEGDEDEGEDLIYQPEDFQNELFPSEDQPYDNNIQDDSNQAILIPQGGLDFDEDSNREITEEEDDDSQIPSDWSQNMDEDEMVDNGFYVPEEDENESEEMSEEDQERAWMELQQVLKNIRSSQEQQGPEYDLGPEVYREDDPAIEDQIIFVSPEDLYLNKDIPLEYSPDFFPQEEDLPDLPRYNFAPPENLPLPGDDAYYAPLPQSYLQNVPAYLQQYEDYHPVEKREASYYPPQEDDSLPWEELPSSYDYVFSPQNVDYVIAPEDAGYIVPDLYENLYNTQSQNYEPLDEDSLDDEDMSEDEGDFVEELEQPIWNPDDDVRQPRTNQRERRNDPTTLMDELYPDDEERDISNYDFDYEDSSATKDDDDDDVLYYNPDNEPIPVESVFDRRERLDVKKPGPFFTNSPNNFFLDKLLPEDSETDADLDNDPGQTEYEFPLSPPGSRQKKDLQESLLSYSEPVEQSNNYLYVNIKDRFSSLGQASKLAQYVADHLQVPREVFSDFRPETSRILLKVNSNPRQLNATSMANLLETDTSLREHARSDLGVEIDSFGAGDEDSVVSVYSGPSRLFLLLFLLTAGLASLLVVAAVLLLVRRRARLNTKIQEDKQEKEEPVKEYKQLVRDWSRSSRASQGSSSNGDSAATVTQPQPAQPKGAPTSASPNKILQKSSQNSEGSRTSSTSSWQEEPGVSTMDISTGHMVLSYMEDHLKNKQRLEQEWVGLCAYEAEPNSTSIAFKVENKKKNRYPDKLPYDHNRVLLNALVNGSNSDYINASTVMDHDPRNPAYIITQGPMTHTVADFWQMVWEQGSVVIVMLSKLAENGYQLAQRYWPEEGSEQYHIFEVHLVSEHVWCDDYLVRSLYLKNSQTGETRTVTQFHFLSWPDSNIPTSTKAILEFRRKVNKSYRGRSCPMIVHCSDGVGRSGTYVLIDMVLNRMMKGSKEIDIAATLEHIRDQRSGMVQTRSQFEFCLMAVAEETHAILKALPQ